MDEVKVDVVRPQRGQRLVECRSCRIGFVSTIVELAGDEDVGTVDTGIANAAGHALLVVVHRRGVDVAVTDLQRGPDGRGRLVGRHLVDPESELGNPDAIAQRDRGDWIHGGIHCVTCPWPPGAVSFIATSRRRAAATRSPADPVNASSAHSGSAGGPM